MYVLALLLACLEVTLVTWLALGVLNGGLWSIVGLIAYLLWSALIGATLKKLGLMLLMASLLAGVYSGLGALPTLGVFVALLIIGEIFPRIGNQMKAIQANGLRKTLFPSASEREKARRKTLGYDQ